MSAIQKMNDLLTRLEQATFSGNETTHYPTDIKVEYSPNWLKLTSTQPNGTKGSIEMVLDKAYSDVTAATEERNFPSPATTALSAQDIQKYKNYGFWQNHMLNDPRHILHHATNITETQTNVYKMEVVTPSLNTAKSLLGITIVAEIRLNSNDSLVKMDVKHIYRSGKEKIMRSIDY